MNKTEKIKKLIKILNEASDAYYNSDSPIMSDFEFDMKIKELERLESETGVILSNSPTQNVGSVVLKDIKEVTHKTPMLSLDKCHSTEEIIKFANNHNLIASIKLDGVSCRLIYEDGNLVRAESRGNGIVGNDITDAVKQFKNVPLHINKKHTYVIDGEALIKLDDFADVNKNNEYKNSRNLTAGTLSSFDTSVVKDRKLSWYAWEVVEECSDNNSFYLKLLEAKTLGFDVVPYADIPVKEFNNLEHAIYSFLKIAKSMNLPQDGVVFKFDDIAYGKSLGSTNHHFKNGIAYKVFNDSVETTLKNIEWTMGKTGSLCPTAIFEPVEIEGTTVEKASLHNISVMNEIMRDPWKGQKIGVYKANLIIPQVRWAEYNHPQNTEFIPIPEICPICGEKTEVIKENNTEVLFCTNVNCQGKLLGKLSHASSKNALNIDGLSEATIKKFIDLGWLKSVKDIYHLFEHKEKIMLLEGFGKKSTEKLLEAIENSRYISLDRFLYSLSIPLIGRTASKEISNFCDEDFDKLLEILTSNPLSLKNIQGFGDKLYNSLTEYWNNNSHQIFELIEEFEFVKKDNNEAIISNLANKVFVITGNLKYFQNRDALKVEIERRGGKVSGSISSKTSYLINNDIGSGSSKNKKAKELGIPIISELDFVKMM